jgi:hypothetical protein
VKVVECRLSHQDDGDVTDLVGELRSELNVAHVVEDGSTKAVIGSPDQDGFAGAVALRCRPAPIGRNQEHALGFTE